MLAEAFLHLLIPPPLPLTSLGPHISALESHSFRHTIIQDASQWFQPSSFPPDSRALGMGAIDILKSRQLSSQLLAQKVGQINGQFNYFSQKISQVNCQVNYLAKQMAKSIVK